MDVDDSVLSQMLDDARDGRRPSMQDVLAVMEASFAQMGVSVEQICEGPPTWTWEDVDMRDLGFPKFYVLSESAEFPGYPVFTVRQAYSPRFDTWVTVSGLVLGPEASGITRSLVLTITHHSGAFAGMRFAAATISANRNVPIAGMVAVKTLMKAPPLRVSAEQAQELLDEANEALGNGTPTEEMN